jgi:hypothetical protein
MGPGVKIINFFSFTLMLQTHKLDSLLPVNLYCLVSFLTKPRESPQGKAPGLSDQYLAILKKACQRQTLFVLANHCEQGQRLPFWVGSTPDPHISDLAKRCKYKHSSLLVQSASEKERKGCITLTLTSAAVFTTLYFTNLSNKVVFLPGEGYHSSVI